MSVSVGRKIGMVDLSDLDLNGVLRIDDRGVTTLDTIAPASFGTFATNGPGRSCGGCMGCGTCSCGPCIGLCIFINEDE